MLWVLSRDGNGFSELGKYFRSEGKHGKMATYI
jgi:hypothetical protein